MSKQPNPSDWSFNLEHAYDAVVRVHSAVPVDAYTADTLGVDRIGSGVVIRADGLVLTMGYLITEAQSIWLTTRGGKVVPGHPLAYDSVSGFGLVMPLGDLDVSLLPLGSADQLAQSDRVILIGHGGPANALVTMVSAKREFAGYWEYLLDQAIITAPAHPQWGGAALVDVHGQLVGIGSLLVQEQRNGASTDCNVVVPIDLLKPILHDLLSTGRRHGPVRPWLGVYVSDDTGQLVIAQVAAQSPAEQASLQRGDMILAVGAKRVNRLPDFYRALWQTGEAGCDVVCTIARDGNLMTMRLRSADRAALLRKPLMH